MSEIEWVCPECGKTGSYVELRSHYRNSLDKCPDCSAVVNDVEDELIILRDRIKNLEHLIKYPV